MVCSELVLDSPTRIVLGSVYQLIYSVKKILQRSSVCYIQTLAANLYLNAYVVTMFYSRYFLASNLLNRLSLKRISERIAHFGVYYR